MEKNKRFPILIGAEYAKKKLFTESTFGELVVFIILCVTGRSVNNRIQM